MTEAMDGESGAMFSVLRWPQPWPPPVLTTYLDSPFEAGKRLQMLGTPEGQLVVLLLNSECVAIHTFESQPIAVIDEGFKLMQITWSDSGVSVALGSHDLKALRDCNEIFFLELGPAEPGQLKSFGDPAAASACKREVQLRAKRYSAPIYEGDVARTLTEELESLRGSLLALEEDVARVRAGDAHRTSAMRAALRELAVNLGRTYQPLLFRVAAKLCLPLPIYAMRKGGVSSVLKDASLAFEPGHFGTTRVFETAELVDLEEWMRRQVVRGEGGKRTYLFQELIAKSAEFLGGAHAAPSVPALIDNLNRTIVGGQTALDRLLLNISDVVVDLGRFVLVQAAQAKS